MSWKTFLFGRAEPPRETRIMALMEEDARAAAYLTAPDNGLFRAILADLDELIVTTSDRAVDEDLPEHKVRFRLGGQDSLMEFKEKLVQRERDARLTQQELERKEQEQVS